MAKFIWLVAFLGGIFNANAEEVYGFQKKILQTSDPFLNKFYDIKPTKLEESVEMSETEKEMQILAENGYKFDESSYIRAIEKGDKINVLRFIYLGMNPSFLKTYDNSTLFYAIRGKQEDTFKLLIDKGADINYVNARSQNMLLQAIELGYSDMINTLVDAGIDLLFMDHNAWTAMHYAIEQKDIKTVFLLLEKEPDLLSYKNKFGNTPLLLTLDKAIKENDKSFIVLAKMLLEKEKYLNVSNAVGNTALHLAATINDYDLVKLLVEQGANPNVKNAKDWRPIDIAVKNENVDMANLLRYYGAEL